MNCVVLGGGGFIGSWVTERFLSAGHRVRVVEHPRAEPFRDFSRDEPLEWVRGDIHDSSVAEAALEGTDALIHLVSTTLPKSSDADPIHDVESNLVGALRLLEISARKGIRKILFISSGGTVYGRPEYLPIDERHPTNPLVGYGITKLAIEKFLQLHAKKHDVAVRILRVANPYGPRQRVETAQGAATAFLHRAIANKPIEIWGDGSVIRDYLHVEDVAEAFLRALEYEGEEQVFNIGSGIGTDLNQLAEAVMKALGVHVHIERKTARSFDVPANVLCIRKAESFLGWKPVIGLEKGLAKSASSMMSKS